MLSNLLKIGLIYQCSQRLNCVKGYGYFYNQLKPYERATWPLFTKKQKQRPRGSLRQYFQQIQERMEAILKGPWVHYYIALNGFGFKNPAISGFCDIPISLLPLPKTGHEYLHSQYIVKG